MNEAKLRSAAGFAMRAGKCIAGDFACEKAVKSGKALAVLLDEAASAATCLRYQGMCQRAGVPCILISDMGGTIGKYGRMVAAVTDSAFARMVIEAAQGEDANYHGGV